MRFPRRRVTGFRARLPRNAAIVLAPLLLSPDLASSFAAGLAGIAPARLASLSPDIEPDPRALDALHRAGRDGPRFDMKTEVSGFPAVDRRLKGDPVVPLRPTLSDDGPSRPASAAVAGERR